MRPDILDLLPDPKCWWRIHYQLYLCVALEFEAHTWQFWSTHEYYRSWKFELQTPSTTLDRTWFVFWKKYFNTTILVSSKKTILIYTYISGRFLYSRIVCWFCSQCGFAAIITSWDLEVKKIGKLKKMDHLRKISYFFIANRSKIKGNPEKGLEKVNFFACGAQN